MNLCRYARCLKGASFGKEFCLEHNKCEVLGCSDPCINLSRVCSYHFNTSAIPRRKLSEWQAIRVCCSYQDCGAITIVACKEDDLTIKKCQICGNE